MSRYLRGHEPAARPPKWTELALCPETDSALFFPPEDGHGTEARNICRSCEARLPCLEYALRNPQHGVWGGFTERSRITVARQQRAGRSLEDIIADDDAEFYASQEHSAALAEAARARRLAREREKREATRQQQDGEAA